MTISILTALDIFGFLLRFFLRADHASHGRIHNSHFATSGRFRFPQSQKRRGLQANHVFDTRQGCKPARPPLPSTRVHMKE